MSNNIAEQKPTDKIGKFIKWFIIFVIGAVLVSFLVSLFAAINITSNFQGFLNNAVVDFETCAVLGNPIMESYPRKCSGPDGKVYTENIGNELEKTNLIKTTNPRPNQVIQSPLVIEGEARGYWFFEASFPIKLVDSDGNIIKVGYAEAQDEWMTEDFVPFKATIEFTVPSVIRGTLILQKDNPSGLPENDDHLEVPVIVTPGTTGEKNEGTEPAEPLGECKPTGCSGQVCSDEDVITTCEYLPQYACYKEATCERQTTGECGWTYSPELSECLKSAE